MGMFGFLDSICDSLYRDDFDFIIKEHEKRMRNNKKIHDNAMSKNPIPIDQLELEE